MASDAEIRRYQQAAVEYVRELYGESGFVRPNSEMPLPVLIKGIMDGPGILIDPYCACVAELSHRILEKGVKPEEVQQAVAKMVEVLSTTISSRVRETTSKALIRIGETPDEELTKAALRLALTSIGAGFDNWKEIRANAAVALTLRGDYSGFQPYSGTQIPRGLMLLLRAICGERGRVLEENIDTYLNSLSRATDQAALIALLVIGRGDSKPIHIERSPDFGLTVREIILHRNDSGGLSKAAAIIRSSETSRAGGGGMCSIDPGKRHYRMAFRSIDGLPNGNRLAPKPPRIRS